MREEPVLSSVIEEITKLQGSLGLRKRPTVRWWLSVPGPGLLLVGNLDQ